MDSKDAETVLHEHREALTHLSRRQLQARAKAFGVRANGKSVDIINMVAKVLSRSSSPDKIAERKDQEEHQENDHQSEPAGTAARLAELAARASAAALTASLNNLRVDTELKINALGQAPASLRRNNRQPACWDSKYNSPEASLGSDEQASSVSASSPDEYAAMGQQGHGSQVATAAAGKHVLEGAQPARSLAGTLSPLLANSSNSFQSPPFSSLSCQPTSGSKASQGSHGSADEADFMPWPSSIAHTTVTGVGCRTIAHTAPAIFTSPEPLECMAKQLLEPATCSASALTPANIQHGAVSVRPTVVFVTDRTPLRQNRFITSQLQPLAMRFNAATPAGRGANAPRTPGIGLHTPARRVPVCTDGCKERAMDEWVMKHLVTFAGSPMHLAGLSWDKLVGLQDAKEYLRHICFRTGAAMEVCLPSNQAQQQAAYVAPSSTVCRGAKPVAGSPSTNAPARAVQRCTLPNAAVLMCGPTGIGKSLLVRALTSDLGAAYLHVSPDLITRIAHHEASGAEVVLRSVVRVSSQLPGPVVVHVEDVEQLVGVEATRQSQEARRLRTELLVAVDELLLQRQAQATSPSHNVAGHGTSPSSAFPAYSPGCGAPAPEPRTDLRSSATNKSRIKVLLLSTTSRPMDMDISLVANLGRTDMILAELPGPDDREQYLVGRLASEGAALGVEQVEQVVRQTEGLSCAQLAALCDGAVTVAAARRASSKVPAAVSLNVMDISMALRNVDQRRAADEMTQLILWWQSRVSGIQNPPSSRGM